MANTETGLNMARNRGQSAADVADATRAAFHLTASAHPTKIKHQKMLEITFYKAIAIGVISIIFLCLDKIMPQFQQRVGYVHS